MNRKMRAKLANQQARQKRSRGERKSDTPLCDTCGGEMIPVLVIPISLDQKPRTLH